MNIFSNTQVKIANPTGPLGSWNERKNRLKDKFPILTDKDLILEANNRDEMFGNLLFKLGKTKAEMHAIIIGL